MLKLYVIEENVSDDIVSKINDLYGILKTENIYGYIYCGYPFTNIDKNKSFIKGLVVTNYGIYQIYSNEEESSNNMRELISNMLTSEKLAKCYLSGQMQIKALKVSEIDTLKDLLLDNGNILDKDLIDTFNALIQHILHLVPNSERAIENKNTLGYYINERNAKIASLDETQFETLYTNNNDNLRIRGLAGSGKTILLVKKMAYLHFKNRQYRMAYVFYTKSLKQYIIQMFKEFYKEFDKNEEPDMSKIVIVHSWGSNIVPGFYSSICDKFGIECKGFSDGNFESVCEDAISKLPKENLNMYDYVFVDEAQDFRINFFKLARKSLTPFGKLIYAYDELQTLDDYQSKMPSKKDIFAGDECKDKNLTECYRSPNEILITAHALGLGIYHKTESSKVEFINYVEDLDILKDVGYIEADGKLSPGSDVVLTRNNTIEEQDYDKILTFKGTQEEQFEYVVNEVWSLIKDNDVVLSDILIIDLDAIKLNENFIKFREKLWEIQDDEGNHLLNVNLVNKDKAINFRYDNSIPYTTVFRAKGNEANIVFILNSNRLNVVEMYNRNRIFTAMTRAKFRVYILGDGKYMDELCEEINDVQTNDYKLKFKCLSIKEQKEFKNKLYQDSKKAEEIKVVLEILNKYKESDPELYKKLLEEQGVKD